MPSLKHYLIAKSLLIFSVLISFVRYFGYYRLEPSVTYVIEGNDWVVSRIGRIFLEYFTRSSEFSFYTTRYPIFSNSQIIHYGSPHLWLRWHNICNDNAYKIVNFYHASSDPGFGNPVFVENFISSSFFIDLIVTSCSITHKRLIDWGITPDKIILIPLAIQTNLFPEKRSKFKYISPDRPFYIGSFQKDSVGWASSIQPKYVKGPDILVETLKLLSLDIPNLHVILTGPSREYVKKYLSMANIKYTHFGILDSSNMAHIYQLIDLYLISSREEGGPLALLESLSSGVPVVSTPCGMSVDLSSELLTLSSSFAPIDLAQSCFDVYSNMFQLNSNNSYCSSRHLLDWNAILPKYQAIYFSILDQS